MSALREGCRNPLVIRHLIAAATRNGRRSWVTLLGHQTAPDGCSAQALGVRYQVMSSSLRPLLLLLSACSAAPSGCTRHRVTIKLKLQCASAHHAGVLYV